MSQANYFVLTGAPGTGKTTVLNRLCERGFTCLTEAARLVLEENLAIQGPALPSNDPLLFIQTMQKKNIADFEQSKPIKDPVFFDRGMPDTFVTDQVRPLPFEKTIEIHGLLTQVYRTFGYNLIEVPTGTVDARVDFILNAVPSSH